MTKYLFIYHAPTTPADAAPQLIGGSLQFALMDMTTSFTLNEAGTGTSMDWEADVKIAGPVGAMGQRVLQPIINQQVGNVLTLSDATERIRSRAIRRTHKHYSC